MQAGPLPHAGLHPGLRVASRTPRVAAPPTPLTVACSIPRCTPEPCVPQRGVSPDSSADTPCWAHNAFADVVGVSQPQCHATIANTPTAFHRAAASPRAHHVIGQPGRTRPATGSPARRGGGENPAPSFMRALGMPRKARGLSSTTPASGCTPQPPQSVAPASPPCRPRPSADRLLIESMPHNTGVPRRFPRGIQSHTTTTAPAKVRRRARPSHAWRPHRTAVAQVDHRFPDARPYHASSDDTTAAAIGDLTAPMSLPTRARSAPPPPRNRASSIFTWPPARPAPHASHSRARPHRDERTPMRAPRGQPVCRPVSQRAGCRGVRHRSSAWRPASPAAYRRLRQTAS